MATLTTYVTTTTITEPSSLDTSHHVYLLEDMSQEHSSGLELLTRTIYNSDVEFCDIKNLVDTLNLYTGSTHNVEDLIPRERNQRFVSLVRSICKERGWIAGWKCFSQAAPHVLHQQLIDDCVTCADVYSRIKVYENTAQPIDVGMTVSATPNVDSLKEVGPKGLGGKAWMVDPEYMSLREKWSIPGFQPIGPSTAFGWNGLNKKTVLPEDRESCKAMQMLGTIDYDLDLNIANNAGFANSMAAASHNILMHGTPIQGSAVTALINADLQRYVRSIQQKWVSESKGSFVVGPSDVKVKDWVKANALDCSAIMGLGYEEKEKHVLSRKGIFLGNLLANMHDALYDMGCSSRVSCTMYAVGGGIKRSDIHNATGAVVVGCFDTIAKRILNMSENEVPSYGDSMGIYAGSWSAFNGRYRTFERLVKYTRQLRSSKSEEAASILEAAEKRLVLVEDNGEADIADWWEETFKPEIKEKLVERVVEIYTPLPAPSILSTPGVPLPKLCDPCQISFHLTAHSPHISPIHAIPSLPSSITSSVPVALASCIRRLATMASSPSTCDTCACRIGSWCDSVAYKVLVALMKTEEETTAKEWILQNYAVACVDFYPVVVPTILGGFDLIGELEWIRGAMGSRDVVDC